MYGCRESVDVSSTNKMSVAACLVCLMITCYVLAVLSVLVLTPLMAVNVHKFRECKSVLEGQVVPENRVRGNIWRFGPPKLCTLLHIETTKCADYESDAGLRIRNETSAFNSTNPLWMFISNIAVCDDMLVKEGLSIMTTKAMLRWRTSSNASDPFNQTQYTSQFMSATLAPGDDARCGICPMAWALRRIANDSDIPDVFRSNFTDGPGTSAKSRWSRRRPQSGPGGTRQARSSHCSATTTTPS